ncbi:MAG TPA: LysM peptidoglycan-binding domain-containing M23 family metallopeptidase [Methylocella sp.]|jgi:murein DD-endopeptidase MepM/ murein hydrolase activator NlpD|nr:LysM peptidoglycan-binding domain-containing M23 family metallopeptidase [Methylocella sp.]
MNDFVCVSRARFAFRLALTGAAAGLLAGCASSERLSDPWSNPFQSSANVASEAPAAPAPVSPVQSRPLGAPIASANPPPNPRIAAVSPPRGTQGAAGWSAQGGSPIVVAQGENAQILANRYGVPVDALVRTNGLASASQVRPGTHIVIPVYNAALAASSGARVAAKSAPGKPATPAKVAGGRPRTLASQAESLKAGKTRTPAGKAAAARKPAAPATKHETAQAKMPRETKASTREPASAPATEQKKTAMASEMANPEFRWPARGRIIQGFKPGGNDGINIAVPEGTSVKAAESGVVAYAGNELKGYGNLILIRHPNGFVSAYANNGDIEVKRGETVKRGQTIAKSGQSGNVASPQLHFELRKGTKPVDPTQYLAGV